MANASNRPDFIADQFGNIRDVRHLKYSRGAASPPPQTPEANSPDYGGSGTVRSQPSQGSGAVLVFPIGLLITIGVFIFRLLGAAVDSPGFSEPASARSFQLANSFYQNEDFDQAITYYDLAIRENPGLGRAFNNRALAYAAKGETDKALADLEEAVRLLPDSALSHNNLGAIYFLTDDLENGVAELDVALSLDPRLAKACFNRGLTYLALGSYDEAIADLGEAIAFTPEYASKMSPQESRLSDDFLTSLKCTQSFADVPLAYIYSGIAYLSQGDPTKAIADLDKALELRPDLAEAHYHRGLAYLAVGEIDEAAADFERSWDPGHAPDLQPEPAQQLGEQA